LIGLALANWAKGNLKQAYRNANTAWKIVNKLPENPVESRLSAVSGIISHARGEYYAADKNFRKASKHLKREPVMLAQIAVNRGLCLQIQKRYNEALKHYRKAERLLVYLDRKGKEIAQIEMLRSSAFFSKGDLINAEAALKRASNLIAEPSDLRTTAFLESSLGRIYLGLGKKREAKKLFKNAAGLWKKVGMPEYELDATGFFET
jgi:tetratricopeptide (TPR) repeat protein